MPNPTLHEHRYGPPPGVEELSEIWNEELVKRMIGIVWDAYDHVLSNDWSAIDWSIDFEDLERTLSEDLAVAIADHTNPYMPVAAVHGPYERESRKKAPAQPPQYDIAFRWRKDPRLFWPLEAKVIRDDADTDGNLKDYIETLKDRFLTGRYAPYTASGSMVGYIKKGNPDKVADNIQRRLATPLQTDAAFLSRKHRISEHSRVSPPGKDYPPSFLCYHLLMLLSTS